MAILLLYSWVCADNLPRTISRTAGGLLDSSGVLLLAATETPPHCRVVYRNCYSSVAGSHQLRWRTQRQVIFDSTAVSCCCCYGCCWPTSRLVYVGTVYLQQTAHVYCCEAVCPLILYWFTHAGKLRQRLRIADGRIYTDATAVYSYHWLTQLTTRSLYSDGLGWYFTAVITEIAHTVGSRILLAVWLNCAIQFISRTLIIRQNQWA